MKKLLVTEFPQGSAAPVLRAAMVGMRFPSPELVRAGRPLRGLDGSTLESTDEGACQVLYSDVLNALRESPNAKDGEFYAEVLKLQEQIEAQGATHRVFLGKETMIVVE